MSVHTKYLKRIAGLFVLCLIFCILWACSNKQQKKDNIAKASALFEKGKIQEEEGKTDSAVYYYRATLDLIEHNDTSALRMEVFQQLGSLFFIHGYYDRSITNYKKAHSIALNLRDSLYASYTLRKIGISQFFKNNLDSSLFFFQKAYRYNQGEKHTEELSSLYNNLAAVYAEKGEFQTSMKWNDKAIATSKLTESLAHNYAQRSNLFLQMNELDSAAYYSHLCISNTDPYIRASSLETLYMIKSLQGSADSIKYFTELNILNDSLWNANKAVEIAEAEFVFEQKKIDELTQHKNQRLFLILGLGVAIVVVGFIAIQKHKYQQVSLQESSPMQTADTTEPSVSLSRETSTDEPQDKPTAPAQEMPTVEKHSITINNELLIKKGEMLAELFLSRLAYPTGGEHLLPRPDQVPRSSGEDLRHLLEPVVGILQTHQGRKSALCTFFNRILQSCMCHLQECVRQRHSYPEESHQVEDDPRFRLCRTLRIHLPKKMTEPTGRNRKTFFFRSRSV